MTLEAHGYLIISSRHECFDAPNQAYDLIDPKAGNVFAYNPNRVWAYIPESMSKLIEEGRVIFPEGKSKRPMLKRFQNELKSTHNLFSSIMINDVGMNTEAMRMLQEILDGNIFDYSKPLSLINTFLKQTTSKKDVILDFFAGSGTTAHAVMQLNAEDGGNRRCISVQLPEVTDEKSGAFRSGYKTIADIGKERIRRAAKKIKEENPMFSGDLGFKVFKLDSSTSSVGKHQSKNGIDPKQAKLDF